MRRRTLLLAGAASAVPSWAGAQCVTDTPAVNACSGGVYVGGAPALDLSFTGGTLDPRITFTRAAGPATYFDVAGVLQTAGTNVARFDFDPVTHAARGLLIEEARTNVCINSQAINSWPTKVDVTITDNNLTSPDGTVNASLVTAGVATTDNVASTSATVASGSTLTGSVFAKRGNFDWFHPFLTDAGSANGMQCWVNLATGAAGSSSVLGTATSQSVAVTSVGNGWYRITMTVTMPVGSVTAFMLLRTASANGSGTRVNNGTYYVWGAGIEVGAFPTSYIPTTSAAATRAADVATMPVGTWFNAAAGTVVADALIPSLSGGTFTFVTIDDGVGTNRIALRTVFTVTNCFYLVASVTTATATIGAVAAGVPFKAGSSMVPNSFSGSVNGAAVVSASGAQPAGMTLLRFGSSNATNAQLNGWISRVRYWPRALSNAELQSVTT